MDFMKTLVGSMAKTDAGDDEDESGAAFDAGIRAARVHAGQLLEEARKYKNPFAGSIFMFVTLWTMVAFFKVSVDKGGKRGSVAKLWHLMRVGLTRSDASVKLTTFGEDWQAGRYDAE